MISWWGVRTGEEEWLSAGIHDGAVQSLVPRKQTMVDMATHDRRTTLLAIRQYHVIYTVLRTGTRWRGSSKCKKQAVYVKD